MGTLPVIPGSSPFFPAVPKVISQIELQRTVPRLRDLGSGDPNIYKITERPVITKPQHEFLIMIGQVQQQPELLRPDAPVDRVASKTLGLRRFQRIHRPARKGFILKKTNAIAQAGELHARPNIEIRERTVVNAQRQIQIKEFLDLYRILMILNRR